MLFEAVRVTAPGVEASARTFESGQDPALAPEEMVFSGAQPKIIVVPSGNLEVRNTSSV
jgi:hypothetical protein